MTTSTLPYTFRALDSDTDLITLDTTGVTFGVATALTAVSNDHHNQLLGVSTCCTSSRMSSIQLSAIAHCLSQPK